MMTLPVTVVNLITAALDRPITRVEPLGGSFGAQLVRVTIGDQRFALKWAAGGKPAAMVAAEARGLRVLAATNTIRVPAVVFACEATNTQPAIVLSEWIESDGHAPDPVRLGEQLAALHRCTAPAYGLDHDNFIGGTPQHNGWMQDWIAFFRERRLWPQIELAERQRLLPPHRRQALERVVSRLERWLGGVPRCPSLIHGDLWGGNVIADTRGTPVLIDPAISYSDREAELAFTELFGGFSSRFYAAYQAAWPLEPGYTERRDLYNLYHLLNHLNLFGEGYGAQVDAIARRYG
ncbi:MAG: fructosamine kinase [Chloroflexus sp.]|jgi:fructosamine-3-kinase|uniref:fructosamine kinase family protein n=1 Tax=Chloroflexus sp. TaxID=1904827 RepID=UPI0021DEA7F3|nr:fructosamine kinase family protein [Chloroflexus sp.]GIV90099.1 MAG: fructosamine kinase [Chloroflexus sp.]